MNEILGRVLEIVRYPVKSMAGERMPVAEMDWQGLEGDRQYGFVRRSNTTRFPWLTARDFSGLVLYRAAYDDPGCPRNSKVTVVAPDGIELSLGDPRLIAALEAEAGEPLNLMQLGIGAYDLMPVSIVTTASLKKLDAVHGSSLDRRRFRTNIIVDSDCLDDAWQGQRISFGDANGAELLIAYGAPRCAMITIDPDTAKRDAKVLRTVAQSFGNAFTMYASVARPGVFREGDEVRAVGP
jgi:uncharacterized protein YcbX